MRQREQIEQSWEVTYAPRPDSGAHRLWSRHESSAEAHSAAREARADHYTDVRVVRVTRYRLAPLVEIAAWQANNYNIVAGKPWTGAGAYVDGRSGEWSAVALANRSEVASHGHRTRRAAIAAAEAALAWLGYRVAK